MFNHEALPDANHRVLCCLNQPPKHEMDHKCFYLWNYVSVFVAGQQQSRYAVDDGDSWRTLLLCITPHRQPQTPGEVRRPCLADALRLALVLHLV